IQDDLVTGVQTCALPISQKNIEAAYLEHPTSRHHAAEERSVLLWSTYPDRLFSDDGARTEALFTNFHRNYIPTIWKNSVQAIPRSEERRVGREERLR